jgi:S1-C subfamily serine protease
MNWTCPSCSRKVPSRLDTCRCGFVREPDTSALGASGAADADARGGTSLISWVVLGAVAAAAAGMLIALQVVPAKVNPDAIGAIGAAGASGAESTAPASNTPNAFMGDPIESVAPAGAPNAPLAPNAPSAPETPAPGAALEDIISRSIPAIVSIEVGQGRGSGFFAASKTVITNRHVINGNVSVTVRLSTGQTLPGRVDISSAEYDLAVVRVDGASPTQALLPLGTVSDVRPGQEVIAIGLALGVFQNSVTRGIISAVRRAERTVILQTDAAINPGNSGGPLLNRQGQVIGINTMKIAGVAESLGFAVAVDHAQTLLSGGRQPNTPLSTSAPVSQPLAPAFSTGSSIDSVRADGTRRYDQIVGTVARHAAQIDDYWNRIKEHCAVRAAPGYDREWFGLWDGRTTLTSPDMSCSAAVRDVEKIAGDVRTAMSTAQEEARRSSVLPGQLRDIRRRYRMDWPGFDR